MEARRLAGAANSGFEQGQSFLLPPPDAGREKMNAQGCQPASVGPHGMGEALEAGRNACCSLPWMTEWEKLLL